MSKHYHTTQIVESVAIAILQDSIKRSDNKVIPLAIELIPYINEKLLNMDRSRHSIAFTLEDADIMEKFGVTEAQAQKAKEKLREHGFMTANKSRRVNGHWLNTWNLTVTYSRLVRITIDDNGSKTTRFVKKNKRGHVVAMTAKTLEATKEMGLKILEEGVYLARYANLLARETRKFSEGSSFARVYKKQSIKVNSSATSINETNEKSWFIAGIDDECDSDVDF